MPVYYTYTVSSGGTETGSGGAAARDNDPSACGMIERELFGEVKVKDGRLDIADDRRRYYTIQC